jgi:copper chaperone CopZ
MKSVFKAIAVLFLLQAVFIGPAQLSGQDKKQKAVKTETMKCWVSMDCEGCKAKIEKNIPFEKGVSDLAVDLPTKTVTITYKPEKTNQEKLEKAIQKLGYKTEIIQDKK